MSAPILHFNKKHIAALKDRGYTFQKLYAADYKTYRKRITKDMTIWLWVMDSLLEIDDWHQHTGAIVEFYKTNRLKLSGEHTRIFVKNDTSEIVIQNIEMKMQEFKDYDGYAKRWEDWRSIFLSFKQMDELLTEIEFLQSNS